MKRLAILLIGAFVAVNAYCQWTIDSCQAEARRNFPLIQQYALIEKTKDFTVSNANKGYLPQGSLSLNGTYTALHSDMLNNLVHTDHLNPKVAYASANVKQTIWDGGAINAQKGMAKASAEVDKENVEVQIYALRDRVNQLFFGVLLLDEQLKQNALLQKELQTQYDKVQAYISGGVANQSDLNEVRVEQLKNEQRKDELQTTRRSYCDMLGAMMGDSLSDSPTFVRPSMDYAVLQTDNNRPELRLYEAQKNFYDSQIKQYKSNNLPKLGLSATAMYGKVWNDMFSNPTLGLFMGGISLSWNFGNLYSYKNNVHKVQASKQMVDVQRGTFLYNNRLASTQQLYGVTKLQKQLGKDDEIVALRTNIRQTAEVKVENGTMSVSDLLTKISEENPREARQNSSRDAIATYNI